MPLSRYQIRNEYSLADPDLYRAADKDDPEALLEGVAMAGLVGVLRQLGDLAEFAAEIFHDLHEEVMTTASRGHNLMVRVQQLEAEFPTMEKAFLSQTSHSSFFYNTGIDWHPNMRMDQNLITHGDLPRFIMDSYEECRGPPRLFHLDKFDVAGAGACLKRYTDPSVFKVETSYFGIASTDVLREKKTRKTKKKGSRWRNRETPETLPTSHAKLHQLFLEERIENGTSDSVRRVKLKRRLSGFPFDSKSGKSYMEKFLKSSSPVHDEVHEIPVDSSPLALPYNSTYESAFEIVEISTVSPEKESKQRTRSPSPSPTREGSALELAMGDLNEVPRIPEESKSNPALEDYDICSTLHKVVNEKEISVDGGIKTGSSVDGYQSDDIASEIDNYVDALTTMESELDTDSELRGKDDLRYLNNLRQTSDVDANDEQVQAHSSDSVSMGNSTLSDDGNSSSKKDLSSFSYSDSHSTAENTPSDGEVSSNVFTSNEILEAEVLLTQESIDEEGQVCQPPGGAISDGAFTEPVEIPSHSSEIGDPYTSLSPSDLIPVSKNAEAVVKEIASVGPETDEMVANLPSIGYVWKQKGDCWSPKLSGEKQLLDEFDDTNKTEALGCMSYFIGPSLSEDGFPLQLSAENQLVDALEDEDLNQDEDVTSTSECLSDAQVISENSSLLSSNTQPLRKLHDEDPNLIEIPSGAYHTSDALVMNGECLSPGISAETPNDSGVEDLNLIIYASVCVSNVLESATEKEITENMPDTVPEIGHENDNLVQNSVETQISPQNSVETQISPQNSVETQISPQNSVIPLAEDESIDPINAELETHNSCVEPVDRFSEVNDPISSHGERSENIIFKEGTPINCDSVESCISGTTTDIPPLWSSKERTSKLREEYFDEPSKIGDGAVMDEAASDPDMFEKDTTAEPSLMPGVHVHFNNMDYESVSVPAAFAGHDDNAVDNNDDDGSSLDLKKLQEGSLSSFGNEHNGLETETCFSQELAVSYITEDVYQHKFASPDLNNLCDIVIDNDSGSQVRDEASDTYIVSGAGSMNLDNAPIIQSSAKDNEQEPEHSEEKADLLPEQIDEKLLNEGEANSELLNQLQKTHYSNHDDHVAPFYASSKSLLENIPSQPSSSELSPQGNSKIDVSEHFLYPSSSLSSGLFLLPDSSQVYVEEMPPLPPLPPVQWRMGKLQHASPAQETVLVQRNQTAFLPLLPSNVNQEVRPLNPFLTPTSANEKSTPVSEQPTRNTDPFLSQVQPVVDHGDSKDNILPPEGTSTLLQKPGSESETLQNDFQAGEGEKVQLSLDSFSHASSVDGASIYALELSHKEVVKPLHQMAPETSSKDIELSQRSALSEENILTCDTTELPSKIANKHDMRTSEESLSWPPAEDGKPHGNRTTKQHRPRSPLIDAVAAHDKSKLRKVTERVRPQIQKEDERDSLLQQIRTKSFNLKPAVVTRASIQGPKTNLKVAAILEKAKTIRQALTGSDDDDDDDSWSDS